MNICKSYIQMPSPGERLLRFQGDTLRISLTLPIEDNGTGWLRTNYGYASIARQEVIDEVEKDIPPCGKDWFDIPMKRVDARRFEIIIPLCEVGHFEAKCYFLKNGTRDPIWPDGPNMIINVEPAETCCANIIYNAFVRQFGPNKSGKATPDTKEADCIHSLDQKGYTVIPKSGTFRDLIKELDFIIGTLGCRFIQLLPIHPTPTTYARMGRFGSPYATLSFTAVDPAQAEFDPKATPLEQFIQLVDAIHERYGKIIIDIAINHTGWAASLHETHPEWLVRGPDGRIQVPGAWGIMWEDLTKLDYRHKDLWQYMADVFLTWCNRGVDGFRCDAGYMIPVPAWKYIVAKVREQFPDTIFFLEGLGGKISVTRDILNIGNLNWAYSELFQNYDRSQIEHYLPEALDISKTDGLMIHFSETHDNNRLASRSHVWAMLRTGLCALTSCHGGFAFANGVEWFATEKIDVHDARSLNWGAEPNQVDYIRRLNTILKYHPAFYARVDIRLVQQGGGNYIAALRHHIPTEKKLLVLVNLDDRIPVTGYWHTRSVGMDGNTYWDLLTGKQVTVATYGEATSIFLPPGAVYCLTTDQSDVEMINTALNKKEIIPTVRIQTQRLRAKVMEVIRFYRNICDISDVNTDEMCQQLKSDPVAFCRSLNPHSKESRVITWRWQADTAREVMLPPNHFLLLRSDLPFRARIKDGHKTLLIENSIQQSTGSHFALFTPISQNLSIPKSLKLILTIYVPGHPIHTESNILLLPKIESVKVQTIFYRHKLLRHPILFLDTNRRGGMLRANALWGKLDSRYDALLAANLHPDYPEDRWIMFTRCRGWIVYQGYSPEIRSDCLDSFRYDPQHGGFWTFNVPTGQGQYVGLTINAKMIPDRNQIRLIFYRHPHHEKTGMLEDSEPVRLILRPDIEDRNFHDVTKAFTGPEHVWRNQITAFPDGFLFNPHPNRFLECRISSGNFSVAHEWQYMVYRSQDAERGHDPHSDLFSPGYFFCNLCGGESVEIRAAVNDSIYWEDEYPLNIEPIDSQLSLAETVKTSLDHYIVKRNSYHTVIAGYPWFLDWGRDTLIFVRGLITDSHLPIVKSILKQFAIFEQHGTLPNMIRGNDARNRNTSDAPLWFFIACADVVRYLGSSSLSNAMDFLNEDCGGRTLRQILISMGQSMIRGTPNGIQMDSSSGLLFSPSHFTWMDTNYPAGTPRQGYPIEIQALWSKALTFLSEIDPTSSFDWKSLAYQVKSSIIELFYLKDKGYLSDCLHASSIDCCAKNAEPDDALRPNQLFAITLDAITDQQICQQVLSACEELLVPGAIRSLADRPVQRPLPIYRDGHLLNNPNYPYQGTYLGDEDTQRKPAYHNGTAWAWVFPSYCEAWVKVYGNNAKETARSWLSSSVRLLTYGCVGHIPEITDGNYPHTPRGCDAQAWSASEWLRVWSLLQ